MSFRIADKLKLWKMELLAELIQIKGIKSLKQRITRVIVRIDPLLMDKIRVSQNQFNKTRKNSKLERKTNLPTVREDRDYEDGAGATR